MAESSAELIERLMGQNDRLLSLVEALAAAQSPVEIIRALNPPANPPTPTEAPWSRDAERVVEMVSDAWGNPDVPLDQYLGFGIQEPVEESAE